MSKARQLADLLDASGDVSVGALDNVDASAITTGTLPVDRVPYVGRRNLLINGGFDVWQRSTDATGNYGYIAPDRWTLTYSTNSVNIRLYRQTSNNDVMDSTYHLGVSSSGVPLAANSYQRIETRFEKAYGVTSGGAFRPVTVSFWARSPQNNYVMVSAGNTAEALFFTSSSTWTKYTHTFNASNADKLSFYFAYDRSEIVDLEISQVQLELGSVATPFEHRSYGEELALCQRYYSQSYEAGVPAGTGGYADGSMQRYLDGGHNWATYPFQLPVPMRAKPSMRMFHPISGTENQVQADGNSYTCAISAQGTKQAKAGVYNTYIGTSVSFNFHWTADAEL